jgi:membrane-associated protein
MRLYCVIYHFAETGLFAGFFLPGDSTFFWQFIIEINRKCAFIDSGFVNVLILSTAVSGILGI